MRRYATAQVTYQTNLAYGAPWTCSGIYQSNPYNSPALLLRFQSEYQIRSFSSQCAWSLTASSGCYASAGCDGTFSRLDSMPYVTIDLGAPTLVTSVTIYNRADGSTSRFGQFQILLGNNPPSSPAWGLVSTGSSSTWSTSPLTNNPACYTQNATAFLAQSASYPCQATGRYLTLQQTFDGVNNEVGGMNLCALFAFGPSSSAVVVPLVAISPPPLHNWALGGGSTWSDSGTSPLPITLFGGAAVLSGTGLSFQPTASQPSPYACIPNLVLGGTDVSFTVWVQFNAPLPAAWLRVFDFGVGRSGAACTGTDTSNYVFLASSLPSWGSAWAQIVQYGANSNVQSAGVPFIAGLWAHVVFIVPLALATGASLYSNGALAGTLASPLGLLTTPTVFYSAFLGRSQYAGDQYFSGVVASFQIYSYHLSPSQIAALAVGGSAPPQPPPTPPPPPVPAVLPFPSVNRPAAWYDFSSFDAGTSVWASKVSSSSATFLGGGSIVTDSAGTTGSAAALTYIAGVH